MEQQKLMTNRDEHAIRALVAAWHRATALGDDEVLGSLMAEDVVFMTPGQEPFRGRGAFLAGFRTNFEQQQIEPNGTIEEILIADDLATCWISRSMTLTPRDGGAPTHLAGSTLSVLHKQPDGWWVILRDVNMMTPVSAAR